MKKLAAAVALMIVGGVSNIHARIDTFVNDTDFRVLGKVHYKTLLGTIDNVLCSDDDIDLESGQELRVNAGTCELEEIESNVLVGIISRTGTVTQTSAGYRAQRVSTYKPGKGVTGFRWRTDTTYRLRPETGTTGVTNFRWVRSTK